MEKKLKANGLELTMADKIEKIEGFRYDWTMTWGPELEATYGQGDWESVNNPAARKAAQEYEEAVLEAIAKAERHEKAAALALRADDLTTAVAEIRAAASLEGEFGDDPTYAAIIEDLEAMAHVEETWEIRIKRNGEWDANVGPFADSNRFASEKEAIDCINDMMEPGQPWADIDPDDIEPFLCSM